MKSFRLVLAITLLAVILLGLLVWFGLQAKKSNSLGVSVKASDSDITTSDNASIQTFTLSGDIYSNASAVKVLGGDCVFFWHWRNSADKLKLCKSDGLVHLNKLENLHSLNKNQVWADWITNYSFGSLSSQTEFVLYQDNPFQIPVSPSYFKNNWP